MLKWWDKYQELSQDGRPFVLATVVKSVGSTPRKPGTKMLIESSGRFWGTIGGGQLEVLVLAEAAKALAAGEGRLARFDLCPRTGQCCGGSTEVFLEVQNQNPRVYVFGAGHVGQALCRTLAETAFDVHVIDDRPEWIDSSRLPMEVTRHLMNWEAFLPETHWCDKKTYAIIMTPSHEEDRKLLKELLARPAAFVGLIGSRTKWARFQQQLMEEGVPAEALKKVSCPVGLDIGGETPQEIAISIAAQLLRRSNHEPNQ
ncbi:MAG: xanthine dehydrogenase accessory protein XdhC [Bdellovibrionaceae bacterium]|nr:xanthine dehydrogenase accessory protein XdhC [Bdellovibrionales bacterium]MCB9083805.1 xanthine dehydrogenase accessory protein XdhC [Pseudobdellovibrionaceae bacterium]